MFLTFGLHLQLAHVLRSAMWLSVWFVLSARPRSWANLASDWNDAAGQTVWEPAFLRVHAVIWRLLLTYLLFTLAGFLAAAAGKALSLQFHHRRAQLCACDPPEVAIAALLSGTLCKS